MHKIKAIETIYNGYRFRSRLEARWAVFFDTLGIKYEYELEGFDLGKAGWYLPDFWLPQERCWVEIKSHGGFNPKCSSLAERSEKTVLLIHGSPWVGEYYVDKYDPLGGWCYGLAFYLSKVTGLELWIGSKEDQWGQPLNQGLIIRNDVHIHLAYDEPPLVKAFTAARQARFEHGESP